jgi:adenylate cyclase
MDMAISFADLVGFTRLGGELEAGELDQVVSTFGRLAADVAGPRVRLVKTIGDAAMFASSEPDRLVASALDLLDAANQAELPGLRVGVASGSVVLRAGDLYGQAVNLASRVTGVARPGSVLCTKEIRDAAPDGFDWSFARRHRLKGIGDAVPLYRARRLGSAEREDG